MSGLLGTWLGNLGVTSKDGRERSTLGMFVAAIAVFAFSTMLKARKFMRNQRHPRARSMSFTSAQMLAGIFPPKAEVRQPVINAIFYFKNCPDEEKMVRNTELLMWYERMRVGVVFVNGSPQIIDLDDVPSLARAIVTTINVRGEKELQAAISAYIDEDIPIVDNKPLWRLHRIVNADGRSCVVGRAHHVIGDGMAMVALMNKLFCDEHGKSLGINLAENKKPIGGKGLQLNLSTIWRFLKSTLEVLLLPMSAYDTDTAFHSNHNQSLRMTSRTNVEFPVVRLDFIKAIKNKAQVTVNDVLLAATSGMLRRYSEEKNDPSVKGKIQVRALMPIAFPRKAKDMNSPDKSLRNLWSLVSAPLAVNEATPVGRLQASAKTTTALKTSPNALVQLFFQNSIVSQLPQFFQRQVALDVFARHSMVFSNVPGPATKVYYCGEAIESMQINFPNLIPQVILISYNGGIFFNMSIDTQELDAKLLGELYLKELRSLAQELGVECSEAAMMYSPEK